MEDVELSADPIRQARRRGFDDASPVGSVVGSSDDDVGSDGIDCGRWAHVQLQEFCSEAEANLVPKRATDIPRLFAPAHDVGGDLAKSLRIAARPARGVLRRA
jgi:hypothetical protein